MRVLIIKTSSMGDVIHTLPALTDAGKALGSAISFDWVVEESFAQIPGWHPLVKNSIPIALRRWRKNLFSLATWREWLAFRKKLRATQYDLIIDAQGLLKSAFVSTQMRGIRCGLDKTSAREPLAAFFYQRTFSVKKNQHAIMRVRDLFSQALGYPLLETTPDYGLDRRKLIHSNQLNDQNPYLVFLHGTTWPTKHWPEEYWLELVKIAGDAGFTIKLPWGNPTEYERAKRIAAQSTKAEVLPRLNLTEMASVLAGAKAVVAVDTGLGHLAAALDVPTVSLYGPTDPILTGTQGQSQVHLAADFACAPCFNKDCSYRRDPVFLKLYSGLNPPCFSTLPPRKVWEAVAGLV